MVVHYPPIEVSSETLTLLSLSHELLTISLKTAVCVLKAFWGLVVFPIMNWTHFKMKINTVSDKCFIMMWLYLLNKHNRLSDYTTLQTACYNVLQLVILCVSHFHISRVNCTMHAVVESQLAQLFFVDFTQVTVVLALSLSHRISIDHILVLWSAETVTNILAFGCHRNWIFKMNFVCFYVTYRIVYIACYQ